MSICPHSGLVGLLLCDWPAAGAGDDWRDRALGVPAGDLNRNGFVGGSLAARLVVVDLSGEGVRLKKLASSISSPLTAASE